MTKQKQIKGSLDEIVEAVMERMFQPPTTEFSKEFQMLQKINIRTALAKFVVCEDCNGGGVVKVGEGEYSSCPCTTPKKGGDDEG